MLSQSLFASVLSLHVLSSLYVGVVRVQHYSIVLRKKKNRVVPTFTAQDTIQEYWNITRTVPPNAVDEALVKSPLASSGESYVRVLASSS